MKSLAFRFRAEGARLSRAKTPKFADLYFNPSITLATRVRIEVLKALANRVTNTKQLAYCVQSGPRPKLSVGPCVGYPGRRQSLNYAPAIKKYGYLLEDQFLEKAYARAQMFFSGEELCDYMTRLAQFYFESSCLLGELERTFLVLREVVALRRQAARENPGNPENENPVAPGDQPVDGELPDAAPPDVPNRGQKRTAEGDGLDPKRAHV